MNVRKLSFSHSIILPVLALVLLAATACAGAGGAVPTIERLVGAASQEVLSTANAPAATVQDTAASAVSLSETAALDDPVSVVAAHEEVLAGIYQRVLPSVVHIRVVQSAAVNQPFPLPDLPFEHPDLPQLPDQGMPFRQQGEGSGFVWDAEGHIVTNNHVVADADRVTVYFADGTITEAEVLGTDPNADLAVIKVSLPADRLVPVQAGDSGKLRVGQMAVAIGNPFGLENTMTYGIVSALGRTIASGLSQFSIPEVIQTDAPINPGNSGGPLLDRAGQVIGINTQIVSDSGSNSGIGFAVPINIARRVVPALIAEGRYDYAWLGISGQSLQPEIASLMDLPADTRGALIMETAEDGPAARAGLRGSEQQAKLDGIEVPVGGDVIVSIDGLTVESMDDLIAYLVDQTAPGDEVRIEVLRDGKSRTVEVTLGTRPGPQE
jgi:2-alkenal reductase